MASFSNEKSNQIVLNPILETMLKPSNSLLQIQEILVTLKATRLRAHLIHSY